MKQAAHDRYQILNRIDAGGMAEVFLARSSALKGFEKHVAIKRVLPNLAANKQFVRMFLDEARLSLHLNHANIVSVFDVGRAGDSYFIVMEYVEGTNLKSVLKHTRLPGPLAVYITMAVCNALSYAHNLKDGRGNELQVVHRDVSPPNILLSWQGEVKLTDFGLARAASQIESTDPGIVKGKFAYLSPEAARGEEIDHRADIFACGTVLWEAITGERLFQGKTDLETIENVRQGKVPKLTKTHGIPEGLDDIIAKAMALDRDERYDNARQLGRDLAKLLVNEGETITDYDLAEWLSANAVADEEEEEVAPAVSAVVEAKKVEAELEEFETLDSSLQIAAAYDEPEPAAQNAGPGFEDPRDWAVFEDGDENRGLFAQLATTGSYRLSLVEEARKRGFDETDQPAKPPQKKAAAKRTQPMDAEPASGFELSGKALAGIGAVLLAILGALMFLITRS